ncbi:MAG: hypothetical protein CMJ53_08940 [Planctomycetaceae bacterium]|nr:hypothetical protein [Planctomycetaceae bacterium]|tara:strand:+ start:20 stop:700 length:681 start_codon:yes stop_codon:yes gene_type:complete
MSRVARRRIRPRRSIILLVSFMLVVGLTILIGLIFSSPDSFQAPPASMLKTASERARLFERNFVSELTRIRKPQAEWAVRIREEDLNAWLWVRLPQWMSHVGADESVDLGSMQAILESNRILVTSTGWVLAFEPEVRSEGLAIHPRPGSSLGRLPVPGVLVLPFSSGLDFDRMLNSLGGVSSTAESLPGRFKLGDGRTVELLETRLGNGELVLVFKTLGPRLPVTD